MICCEASWWKGAEGSEAKVALTPLLANWFQAVYGGGGGGGAGGAGALPTVHEAAFGSAEAAAGASSAMSLVAPL